MAKSGAGGLKTFYVLFGSEQKGYVWKPVAGRAVFVPGVGPDVFTFAHRTPGRKTWYISDARTGSSFGSRTTGRTIAEAIENASLAWSDAKRRGFADSYMDRQRQVVAKYGAPPADVGKAPWTGGLGKSVPATPPAQPTGPAYAGVPDYAGPTPVPGPPKRMRPPVKPYTVKGPARGGGDNDIVNAVIQNEAKARSLAAPVTVTGRPAPPSPRIFIAGPPGSPPPGSWRQATVGQPMLPVHVPRQTAFQPPPQAAPAPPGPSAATAPVAAEAGGLLGRVGSMSKGGKVALAIGAVTALAALSGAFSRTRRQVTQGAVSPGQMTPLQQMALQPPPAMARRQRMLQNLELMQAMNNALKVS